MWLSEKNKQIAQMFSDIAPTYDLLNHLLSFNIDKKWRKEAISYLQGKRFLDVACGSGDVALLLRRQYKDSEIIGVDLSFEMIRIARKKSINKKIDYILSPAERLPFKDETFDGIVIAFGFRNVVDRVSALFEFKRVLKRSGMVVILEFNNPTNRIFGALYNFYSFTLMPFLGRMISGNSDAYRYLPDSIRRFPDVEFLKKMMEQVGFKRVVYKPLTFGVSFIHIGYKE